MSNHRSSFVRRGLVLLAALALLISAFPTSAFATPPGQIGQGAGRQQDEGAVSDLDGVESAVIQIEAVGSFVDPSDGVQMNVPGFGSGFIVSPDGIAVTNNHVVTGGALYRVYVSGQNRPVNARVLGASECADLAVIDLQGGGYPYLAWYDGPVRAGLDVYAAGFPLGDPEFALTRGIVSKAADDGESSWASIDYSIMHDATINPGNSGGPLVTADGQVVAVNYAGDDDTNQYFAIPGEIAQEVIAELAGGNNLWSLGINAEAFDDGDGFSGLWVYSVKSGTPADLAGIRPGDIIFEIEGVPVGVDGIMADYCDIVASHDSTDVMSVKVYRGDTDEVLEGQFNGRVLAAAISVSGSDTPQAGQPNNENTVADTNTYVELTDDAGILYLEVPDTWEDTTETEWTVGGEVVGNKLTAAPDLQDFADSWATPGVVFSFSDSLQDEWEPLDFLDTLDYSDVCTYDGRTELSETSFFLGGFDEYSECGGGDTIAFVAALVPADSEDYMIALEVYATSDEDIAALDHILDTFDVSVGSSAPAASAGGDIFDLVDVSGLEYDYVFHDGPYVSAIIPEAWDDILEEDWLNDDGDILGKVTRIAADIEEHRSSWNEPGVMIYLLNDIGAGFDPEEELDAATFDDDCEFIERVPYEHTIYGITYTGGYDVMNDCNGGVTYLYTGAFVSDAGDHAYYVDFVSGSEGDDEAFDTLLSSFFYSAAVQPLANPDEFTTVIDDAGRISVLVPVEWVDVESAPFIVDDEEVGVEMTVAIDVEEYNDSWEASGMYAGLWEEFGDADTGEILDTLGWDDDCDFDSRYDLENERFTGQYDLWADCGGVDGSTMATFALYPVDSPDDLLIVYLYMATPDDLRALDPMLNSLSVVTAADPTAEENAPVPAEEPTEVPVEESSTSSSDEIYVDIVTPTLNVRSGPGTNYERIATVSQGFVMLAVGQWNNCAWLLIEDVDGEQGWVSGDPAYTALNGDCADVPEMDAPAAPASSSNTGNSSSSGTSSSSSNNAQGCITWVNQIGDQINVTLTRQSDNWNTTFVIAKGGTNRHCADPGEYTYTAAAPNYESINGELTYERGMESQFDLGEE